MSETIRIQFDMDKAIYDEKVKPYVRKHGLRHDKAHDALIEWATRKAGRDKKARAEQLASDAHLMAPVIQEILDSGLVVWKGKK
jgi:hypothetical protein